VARTRIFEGHHRVDVNQDAIIVELPSGEKCWAHVNVYSMRARVQVGSMGWISGSIVEDVDGVWVFRPCNSTSKAKLAMLATWKRKHALTMKNGHYIEGRKAA
jgi:hypothetical protein